MNQSFQESNVMLVDVSEKLPAFREKLKLRKRKIVSQKTASFSVFNQFLEDMSFDKVHLVIERHLDSLIQEFDLIIPKKAKNLVRNSFDIDVDALPESCQSISEFHEEFSAIVTFSAIVN